jgi:tRNA threonylcarbamoyl adenosine modification protein (Sua5/YciO/YrdC/YwlC family)
MIEYVTPGNIDDRVLRKAAAILASGGILALPTDTTWAIVCSAASRAGIASLRKISGEREERRFTLLCSNIGQFSASCAMETRAFRLINRLAPGPYTFILKTLSGTEKSLNLRRQELGVRLPDAPVVTSLIDELKSPLYSITAKRTMTADFEADDDDTEEDLLFEEGRELEDIDGVDLVLDTGEPLAKQVSTVLSLMTGEPEIVRQGAGSL